MSSRLWVNRTFASESLAYTAPVAFHSKSFLVPLTHVVPEDAHSAHVQRSALGMTYIPSQVACSSA